MRSNDKTFKTLFICLYIFRTCFKEALDYLPEFPPDDKR